MLYNILYMMLCNMLHNMLHNMLRAKKPPSHFFPPWVWICLPAVPVYSTITCLLGPHHRRGPCHVSGGAHRWPLLGCCWGCVKEERRWLRQPLLPVVLGRILGVPGQHLLEHGILSVPEGQHSEEARQVGYQQLGHAWHLLQSNEPVADQMPRAVPKCSG
jgi:hypothetical protein